MESFWLQNMEIAWEYILQIDPVKEQNKLMNMLSKPSSLIIDNARPKRSIFTEDFETEMVPI